MRFISIAGLFTSSVAFTGVQGFSVSPSTLTTSNLLLPARPGRQHVSRSTSLSTKLQESSHPSRETSSWLSNSSSLYGGLWAVFLAFGLFFSPGTIGDPADTAMIQAYIDNPAAPEGINPVFLFIFNGLGVMPLVISQLACPQGSKDGPPAAPFLSAAFGMGYGAAGLYLSLRAPPVESKTREEASWVTRNVLENKIVSVGALSLLASSAYTSISSLDHGWAAAVADFVELIHQSKFVSVSSLDLIVLTIAAAALIPGDLKLRSKDDAATSEELGRNVAAATVFFPILGAALYCLWRPSLPES